MKKLAFAALAAVAVGCGGGGGRGGSSGDASSAVTSADPTSTSSSPHARAADFGDPSAFEQELLELANRARKDPSAEGRRFGVDLSAYAARPPLSANAFLASAAASHAVDMATRRFYGHQNPDGIGPNGRILSTPYDLNALYGTDPVPNHTENIAAGTNALLTPKEIHRTLIVDQGINPPKHRNLILGISTWSRAREMGVAYRGGNIATHGSPMDDYLVEELAYTNTDAPFVTGVVFQDKDLSGEYDQGEGVAGATVTLRAADGSTVATTTATAGGYAFEVLDPGEYDVLIEGASFGAASTAHVTVGRDSVKVDGVVGLGAVAR